MKDKLTALLMAYGASTTPVTRSHAAIVTARIGGKVEPLPYSASEQTNVLAVIVEEIDEAARIFVDARADRKADARQARVDARVARETLKGGAPKAQIEGELANAIARALERGGLKVSYTERRPGRSFRPTSPAPGKAVRLEDVIAVVFGAVRERPAPSAMRRLLQQARHR